MEPNAVTMVSTPRLSAVSWAPGPPRNCKKLSIRVTSFSTGTKSGTFRTNPTNPGRRSLAKMMLNSFWGKYGQQGNKSQVKAISSPDRLYNLLNDDTQELQTLLVMNDKMIKVSTGTSRTKIPCKSTSTSLWLVSPLVGPNSNSRRVESAPPRASVP